MADRPAVLRSPARRLTDRRGAPLRVGDRVRVVGLPDLSGMAPDAARESSVVFEHLVGTCRTVGGFTEQGLVEIWTRILRGPLQGRHWVAIEPGLLLRQKSRNHP